jgi:hypothetical protein
VNDCFSFIILLIMHRGNTSQQNNIRKNELLYLNIFWGGLIFYSLGNILSSTNTLDIKIGQAIQVLGVIAMIITGIFLGKTKIESGYLRTMFILYFTWLITIIFRGHDLSFDYVFMKRFLFELNNGGLIYFAPLVLLFPKSFAYYKKLFVIINIGAVLFLVLCFVFIKKLLVRGEDVLSQNTMESLFDLGIPAAFLMLTYLYHSNKRNLLAIGTVAVILIFSVIRARRGLIFITSSIIFYSILFYFFHTRKKLIIIYFSILFLSITAIYASNLYNIKGNRFIGFLYERSDEDTRTPVELCFYDDMKATDWIAGRGITGEYFCPGVEENQVTNYRTVIETGYLQLILKGGIINLGLLLLITVPAIIKGIFFSKNILSKAAGIWIFQFTLDLYPQNSVAFNFSYLLVWISVGICYSKEIRKLPDNSVKNILNNL